MRGPKVSRGALCEDSGVSNAGSGGSFEVKTFDLGKSAKGVPAVLLLDKWDAIWPNLYRADVDGVRSECEDIYRPPGQARSARVEIMKDVFLFGFIGGPF